MNRYAIVLFLPELIEVGVTNLIHEISEKFNTSGSLSYPPHIPLKYGFNTTKETEIKSMLQNIKQSMPKIPLKITTAANREESMVYLKIEPTHALRELQTEVLNKLKQTIPEDQFREVEFNPLFEFHLTIAEGDLNEHKVNEILKFLESKNLGFTCHLTNIGALIKTENGFQKLSQENTTINQHAQQITKGTKTNEENTMKSDLWSKLTNSNKPFIIGEIGSNHNGNMNIAKELIDVAVDAGCDAVKFQSWLWNSLFSKSLLDAQKEMKVDELEEVGLEAIQKKLALTKEQHFELQKYCQEKDIIFSTSIFDLEMLDFLNTDINLPFWKIASLDIINFPLLKAVAKTQKPIVLSTGMATMSEIEQALDVIKSQGNEQVILLHCVAVYPPKDEYVNLKNIKMLADCFNLPVGFSDHSTSVAIPAAATVFGASLIEKHMKLVGQKCRDAPVSLEPAQLKEMVKEVRSVATAIGVSRRVLTEDEMNRRSAVFGRRSILAKTNLMPGDVITEDNLTYKRPGNGVSPSQYESMLGKKLKVAKGIEEPILFEDLN